MQALRDHRRVRDAIPIRQARVRAIRISRLLDQHRTLGNLICARLQEFKVGHVARAVGEAIQLPQHLEGLGPGAGDAPAGLPGADNVEELGEVAFGDVLGALVAGLGVEDPEVDGGCCHEGVGGEGGLEELSVSGGAVGEHGGHVSDGVDAVDATVDDGPVGVVEGDAGGVKIGGFIDLKGGEAVLGVELWEVLLVHDAA